MSFRPLLAAALLGAPSLTAQIATTLANPGFESQTTSGEQKAIDGWFESSTANNYQDWVNIPPANAVQFPAAQGNVAVFSNDSGFLYQTIGVYAGEPAVRVTGKAVRRYPGGQRAFRPFRVSLYQTPSATAGAEGTHPSALSGGTLLSTRLFTAAELGLDGSYSSPQTAPFQADLSLAAAGATTGSRLWLVFDAEAGSDETGLDDLSVSVLATDPGVPAPQTIGYATVQELLPSDSDARIVEKAAKLLPRENQVTWQRMEMTYFIHYGPNAFTGVEWGTGKESPSIFNPTALDATQWVREIRNAGGKMVMLVAKHHDGFCLWPSRYTAHDVASSPWLGGAGDLVKAVSAACAAEGLKFGVYLSPADLFQIESSSGYYGNGSNTRTSTIPTEPASFLDAPSTGRTAPAGMPVFDYPVDDYNRYFLNQLYELLTEYGPVHEVWFDGANPKPGTSQTYNRAAWYDLIHRLRPEAVIAVKGPDARWVGNESGRARETEWSPLPVPVQPEAFGWGDMTAADLGSRAKLTRGSFLTWYPAEADVPVLHGWFWAPSKTARTASELVDIYFTSVGRNANLLLNLSPDNRGIIPDKQLSPLRAFSQVVRQSFATNLAAGAAATADSMQSGQAAANAIDDDLDTWWEPAAGQSTAALTLALPATVTFDVISLQEAIAQRGQRIESFAVDVRQGGAWSQCAAATTVGHKRLIRLASPVTGDGLRVRILQSRTEPTLATVSLHKLADLVPEPSIARSTAGMVTLSATAGDTIRYTRDGAEPGPASPLYQSPFSLTAGGTVKAIAVRANGSRSLPSSRTFGLAPTGWTATADSAQSTNAAALAIDGNPATYWHTAWDGSGQSGPQPHALTIDLGTATWMGGFTYLPRQDGATNGIVKRYRCQTSPDGNAWTNAAEGAFDNIRNNPVEQTVRFAKPVRARWFRFVTLEEVDGRTFSSAAEISILPGGYDGWKADKGLPPETSGLTPGPGGLPLLLAYYLARDPARQDPRPALETGLADERFHVSLQRLTAANDVTVWFERSDNLLDWLPADELVLSESDDNDDGTTTDRYAMDTVGAAQRFVRLCVTR